MMNKKNIQDALHIKKLVGSAYSSAEKYSALVNDSNTSPLRLQKALETITAQFEQAALTLRAVSETHSSGNNSAFVKPIPPSMEPAGSIDIIENRWLHIRLETLLPHCRYQQPAYLADTIRRLLDSLEAREQKLPYYKRALLVIDEHSHIDGRRVFDQDNKGWKAIPNALKGRVIPDDDQYTLGIALISSERPEDICHITMMDIHDAADFFALRTEECTMECMYRGF